MHQTDKERYGLVETPEGIVSMMLNLLPMDLWKRQDCMWLDAGCGLGNFAREIARRLGNYHDIDKVKSCMLDLVDINEDMLKKLRVDGYNCKCVEYIKWSSGTNKSYYDVIIGNPPYNFAGLKKVPSNKVKNKKNDGKTIWPDFVKNSIRLLRPNGYLCFITPALWLKRDNAGLNSLLLHNPDIHISHIYSMSDVETNRVFRGEAQIASTIFLLQKTSRKITKIWDNISDKYIEYDCSYPVPLYGAIIVKKLLLYVTAVGNMKVKKTNTVGKNIKILETNGYPAVRTCLLYADKNGIKKPQLKIEYSNEPCPYYGQRKIIMAHKRLGFPYIDRKGEYGISARDNYVICDESLENLEQQQAFLSTKFARYIFGVTSYRMKFLEKYVFELLPEISLLSGFPARPTDADISAYFSFTCDETDEIENFHRQRYGDFCYDLI